MEDESEAWLRGGKLSGFVAEGDECDILLVVGLGVRTVGDDEISGHVVHLLFCELVGDDRDGIVASCFELVQVARS